MNDAPAVGRVVVVGATAHEAGVIAALAGARSVPVGDLESAVDGDVAVVVIGSRAPSPISLAQRAHRVAPHAGVAILTTPETDAQVRRQLSYAPGVPLELAVLGADDALPEHVERLRTAAAHRRRHLALLHSVAARSQGAAPERRPEAVQLRALFEQAPLGIVVCDPAGALLGWNRYVETLLGLGPQSLGVSVDTLLPGAGHVVAGIGTEHASEVELVAGSVEVEVSAVASELDDGRPAALLLVVDVTTRRAAERARDRLAGHVDLLAEVSDVLTTTLDPARAVELLAESVVPALGDWALVRITEEQSGTNVVAVRHRDPALAAVTARVERLVVPGRIATPLGRRIATGATALLTDLRDADLAEHLGDPELCRLVTQLGVHSLLAVPLPGRTGVLGALVVGASSPARELTDTELAVAAEVGRRGGTALDNARLYAQQRELATELQRSLLTDPPDAPYAQVVARYVAAAQQSQVGGDWYDAFVLSDDATVVVIGDVVGHDTRAAAAMGQLRGLLRGIAYTTNGSPADVLTRVDAAIEGLCLNTTATAVVARICPPGAAGVVPMTWSNAGHPPPIVVRPDGSTHVLAATAAPEADLLLGIDPLTARRDLDAEVPLGSTVLLYTDGLVERRGQSLDEGIGALAEVLAGTGDLPLGELCQTVLRRMLPAEPEDDVAMVAVRVRAAGG